MPEAIPAAEMFPGLEAAPVAEVPMAAFIDEAPVAEVLPAAEAIPAAIVEAVVSLCEALGLSSVAEGVETGPELDLLTTLGCTSAQGHLLAPALSVGALQERMTLGPGGLVLQEEPAPRGS